MLAREEWVTCPGTPPMVNGLVWDTDGSKTGGDWGGVYRQSVNRWLSIPLGKHATVFQAEVYAILACDFKLKPRIGQRLTLVLALTFRRILRH
jgi:hypothetical protein